MNSFYTLFLKKVHIFLFCLCFLFLTACSDASLGEPQSNTAPPLPDRTQDTFPAEEDTPEQTLQPDNSQEEISKESVPSAPPADSETDSEVQVTSGSRDNTPVCLIPETPGAIVYGNDTVSIDASNTGEGYLCVRYTGACPKVKLQIIGPDSVTYTYNLSGGSYETFPLTGGSGTYSAGVYENISGTQYATAFYQETAVTLTNEFGPFLYPSQYVNFTPQCETVSVAQKLSASADTDLDVVSNIYNYVISSISYDYDKASGIASGYISNVDETLHSGTGICLDYAALMAAMLRSQGIPTHLEVGYAKDAYHAWISTYIDEKGWVNGIIEFDGQNWSLMDPTFASNSSESALKKFIGDGSNYTVKYVY